MPNDGEAKDLLDLIGPFYDAAGVSRYLGISTRALDHQVKHLRLLGMATAEGTVVYPVFQFDGPDLLAGLPEVLAAFRGVRVDGWTLASWLVAPLDGLDGISVIDWLRAGRDGPLARAHAQAAAARWSG